MPVQPTYPGIYIEELPSSAHTITAAPTSITVFIGYTHPFKTKAFYTAVRIFSFFEYERAFGGLYASGRVQSHVAYAVQQFFLNGGSDAYVVGLKPQYHDPRTGAVTMNEIPKPSHDPPLRGSESTAVITFKAREPTDRTPMEVRIDNLKKSDPNGSLDTADIIVTYGVRSETLRGVKLADLKRRLEEESELVEATVEGVTDSSTPYPFASPPRDPIKLVEPPNVAANWTTFSPVDFTDAMKENSSLDKVDIFNLMAVPGIPHTGIWATALAFCEKKRAFFIADPPEDVPAVGEPGGKSITDDAVLNLVPRSTNGALYFPYVMSLDPLSNRPTRLPPSGYVAGIYARTDNNRGVWKAPAGLETILKNVIGVVPEGRMTDATAGNLNDKGVNAIRTFPDAGTVVFGARTLVARRPAIEQWKYVPVRRMALFIEQSLYRSLGWAVFEPNDEPLWVALRTTVERFMLSLFRQGAFQGSTPSQAFLVKCDGTTTTQDDIDAGRVNIIVGFRPLKPAEFVIIKIAQLAGQVQA